MPMNRRSLLRHAVMLPLGAAAHATQLTSVVPAASEFHLEGVYLNSAFTHPISRTSLEAGQAYLRARAEQPKQVSPMSNARNDAVSLFAGLINAQSSEVAVVPSTMEGENLVALALGIGAGAGVITDTLHYDASVAMYGELQKRGVPVAIVRPRDNRIELDDVARAITPSTRLLAVSLVSSTSGFSHDLDALCELAHRRGVLVYVDIIQAVGAVPFDVKKSGVDFCCSGSYKFLMGDFGTAFLYVRPDHLTGLRRTMFGWRQFKSVTQQRTRFDRPLGPFGEETLRDDTASYFEVSTPAWGPLAIVAASMRSIQSIGVESISRHRQPMLSRLSDGMQERGFEAITPVTSASPLACFAMKDTATRIGPALKQARVSVSVYSNYLRASFSIFNTMDDVEQLLQAVDRGLRS